MRSNLSGNPRRRTPSFARASGRRSPIPFPSSSVCPNRKRNLPSKNTASSIPKRVCLKTSRFPARKRCSARFPKRGTPLPWRLRSRRSLRNASSRFGFTPFLSAVAGSGTDGSLPTKADVIREAMRLLNAPAGLCLMVGDQTYDAIGARACGVDFAGLDIGYAEKGELEKQNPDYLFSNFRQLTELLTK